MNEECTRTLLVPKYSLSTLTYAIWFDLLKNYLNYAEFHFTSVWELPFIEEWRGSNMYQNTRPPQKYLNADFGALRLPSWCRLLLNICMGDSFSLEKNGLLSSLKRSLSLQTPMDLSWFILLEIYPHSVDFAIHLHGLLPFGGLNQHLPPLKTPRC